MNLHERKQKLEAAQEQLVGKLNYITGQIALLTEQIAEAEHPEAHPEANGQDRVAQARADMLASVPAVDESSM